MSAAILDEDELLGLTSNEPVDVLDYGLDEELLLGPGYVSRTTTLEYECEIPSKPDADSELIGNDPSTTFEDAEKEELDYEEDEEEEREERVGKFTSERKPHNENSKAVEPSQKAQPSGFCGGAQRGAYQYRGRGVFNNNRPNNRGGINRFVPGNTSGLPSLMNMPLGMGPSFMVPGISMNGPHGKILVNPNFQQPQPLVRLNIPGVPTITMPPPPLPINPMQQNGPIIPRLPNGIPLLPTIIQGPPISGISGIRPPMLPQNHGMAGFGSSPGFNCGLPPTNGPVGSWDQAVHQFLSQPPANSSRSKTNRRRSRSSSYSSASSYSSSSRSRSRSRSPRRHRRDDHRKSDRVGRRTQRARGGRDPTTTYRSRGGNNNYRKNDNRSHSRRNDKMVTEECAKAVGVDNDYLSRMAEQKRQREEIMRKKEQRRTGVEDEKEIKELKKQTNDLEHGIQEKLKPCLCVHAKGLKQLTTAKAKVEAIAKEIGHVKKCWQWDDDQITVVFAELNHAKEFTMKYNGKVLSGLRMAVTMTKEYLNLNNLR